MTYSVFHLIQLVYSTMNIFSICIQEHITRQNVHICKIFVLALIWCLKNHNKKLVLNRYVKQNECENVGVHIFHYLFAFYGAQEHMES